MAAQPQKQLDLKQHFTDARPINDLMCQLLGNVNGLSVLEPSVGHGAFLGGLRGTPSSLDVVDVDSDALHVVQSKFAHLSPRIYHQDFIDLFVDDLLQSSHPLRTTFYDRLISNPPYGLYFDLPYRRRIKGAFPGFYARESYGLFFAFSVSRLRQGGRYVFLVPDTFLSSVNHRPLRLFMCSEAAPTHIIRFPSKLFETVAFGYGNLCIVAGEKRPVRGDDQLCWLDLFEKDGDLSIDRLAITNNLTGDKLLQNAEGGWSSPMLNVRDSAPEHSLPLGAIAECRTGIYTGDNQRFIGYDAARITRRLNGHSIEWFLQVFERPLTRGQQDSGLTGERHYVPLVRGGHREPFDTTAWAIDWSPAAIEFYRSNKKARLQNSRFYFREGISVPMVTTKRISAALMDNAVFDQGVVGVFPKIRAHTPALLLYLNSNVASERMKALVNGSANNSANYLKRLPVPSFSKRDLGHAERLVEEAKYKGSLPAEVCDSFVQDVVTKLPH